MKNLKTLEENSAGLLFAVTLILCVASESTAGQVGFGLVAIVLFAICNVQRQLHHVDRHYRHTVFFYDPATDAQTAARAEAARHAESESKPPAG